MALHCPTHRSSCVCTAFSPPIHRTWSGATDLSSAKGHGPANLCSMLLLGARLSLWVHGGLANGFNHRTWRRSARLPSDRLLCPTVHGLARSRSAPLWLGSRSRSVPKCCMRPKAPTPPPTKGRTGKGHSAPRRTCDSLSVFTLVWRSTTTARFPDGSLAHFGLFGWHVRRALVDGCGWRGLQEAFVGGSTTVPPPSSPTSPHWA